VQSCALHVVGTNAHMHICLRDLRVEVKFTALHPETPLYPQTAGILARTFLRCCGSPICSQHISTSTPHTSRPFVAWKHPTPVHSMRHGGYLGYDTSGEAATVQTAAGICVAYAANVRPLPPSRTLLNNIRRLTAVRGACPVFYGEETLLRMRTTLVAVRGVMPACAVSTH
jgi:hypothetical protein